ncbi:hypothetical protein BLNAU_7846 [Blattamonas nauphoetae]|uniref:Uncharacterized protein n=1 Tax=Blattamonas nauphoetae TaxID=2049346 RepID=A0ABQ9Y0J4_9EUKA|nr:hypothetical protein BLNAU_7846 [Blattamonas nauphoetae]
MSMTFDALETVASQTHSQEEIDALTTDDTVPPVAHLNWVFRKIGRGDKHKPKSNKDGKVDAQVLSNQEKERVLLTLSRWVAECEDDIISENLWPPIIVRPFFQLFIHRLCTFRQESIPIVSAGCHISVASSFAGLLVRKSAANDQTTSAPSIPKQHLPSLLSIVSSVLLSSDEGASLAWMDLMSQILDLDPEGDIHIGDIVDLILQKSEVFESSPIKIATSRLCASLLRFIAAKMDLYPKHKDLAFEKEFSIDRELDKALESSESGKDGQSTSNSKDSRDRPDGDAVAPHFEELILSFPSFESDNTQSMFYPNHHTLPPLYRLSVNHSAFRVYFDSSTACILFASPKLCFVVTILAPAERAHVLAILLCTVHSITPSVGSTSFKLKIHQPALNSDSFTNNLVVGTGCDSSLRS